MCVLQFSVGDDECSEESQESGIALDCDNADTSASLEDCLSQPFGFVDQELVNKCCIYCQLLYV